MLKNKEQTQPQSDEKEVVENTPNKRYNADLVYIINPNSTSASENFASSVEAEIKKLGLRSKKMPVNDFKRRGQVSHSILICNNNSRIQADLRKCLQDLSGDQLDKTLLLVLHAGGNKQFSTKNEAIKFMQKEKNKFSFLDVIDMVYDNNDPNKSIRSYDMNREAYTTLKRVLPVKNRCIRCCFPCTSSCDKVK